MSKEYYWTLDRNSTEDEITIYTPDDRAMLCVAFWDKNAWDDGQENAPQLKSDAQLIVDARNGYRKGRAAIVIPKSDGHEILAAHRQIDLGWSVEDVQAMRPT